MWTRGDPGRGCLTPPPAAANSRWRRSPVIPQSALMRRAPDMYHVFHKFPTGYSPYVKAKHVQLIDKDPNKAISLFWAAINSGDRVDSALKDMAIVMKQLDRSDEAIEAIKSFRHLCPHESQEPLDNILLELYKRSGRIEDQIKMLEIKVKGIEQGFNFGGKRVKPARSQGKKIYMTTEQEYSRLLGNLAWAYMQNNDFKSAEEHYRKALSLEPDKNKQCNLAICLMNMKRITEAKLLLHKIRASSYENGVLVEEESYARSHERATDMLTQLESNYSPKTASRGLLTPGGVLQTQPRRCLGSIEGGDRTRPFLGDDGRCARKIAFEFGENNDEKYFSSPKNNQQRWADMVKNNAARGLLTSGVLQTQPRNMGSINGGDRRRPLLRDDGRCARKLAFGENNNVFINGGKDNVEENNSKYMSTPKNNSKSWADMVDEEERQGMCEESSFLFQTQPCGKLNNENLDCNKMGFKGNSNLVSSLVNFVEEERENNCVNGIKMLKRSGKRLQVFKDITSSSESRRNIG